MDIKQQTQNVAAQGRYGDSMLLHVNPAEVQGLASIMPLTKNPETGQPEAFLPFLAPLLGSMAGTALFTGLSAPVAGAIGSGIASAIQSGDLKQGIISGLTGFGLGKAFGAAGIGGRTAGEAATTAAETVANVSPEALTETLTRQAAATTPMLGNTPIDLSSAASGTTEAVAKGGLDAFASELAKPSSYLPVALGEGTTGTIQAQEDFEKAMREYELGQQKKQEEMMAMYPEQIPMSSPYFYGKEGGIVNMEEGRKIPDEERSVSLLPGKGRIKRPPIDRLPPPPPPTDSFEAAMSGGLDAYYTPPKQLSGPVTAESVPVIDPMTGAPMIDPNTGMPVPSGQFKPSANYRPGIDPEFNYLPGGNRPASFLGNYLGQTGADIGGANPYLIGDMFNPMGPNIFNRFDFNDMFRNFNRQNFFEREPMIDFPRNDFRTPPRFSVNRIDNNIMDMTSPPIPPQDFGFGPGIRRSEDFFNPEDLMMPPAINVPPPVTPPMLNNNMGDTVPPVVNPPVPPPPVPPVPQINMPVENPFIQLPTSPLRNDFMSIGRLNNPPFMMEEGKQIPDDAKGLQALARTEKGKEAVKQMGFELQTGGLTPSPDEIREVQMAILGEVPNNTQVIDMFVQKYGNEIFNMIRQQVLNSDGNAQTMGMIEGMGGGMDDLVLGMIGSQQRVAVSPGEYIVPADVVSGLGDGSSDAGAKELDNMLDRVRQERTNTTKQPKELNKGKVLPK